MRLSLISIFLSIFTLLPVLSYSKSFSLGGLDIQSLIGGISGLLSNESITELESVIHHAYILLDDTTTNQTKTLITAASSLVTNPQVLQEGQMLLTEIQSVLAGILKENTTAAA
ncbi:MAG: hypothetical protein M1818_008320 [Claussenomyces sp. TS43310]|nr:MAG: hypothetical protein M1818_008320 [Claussenomyces sp. TS43310]